MSVKGFSTNLFYFRVQVKNILLPKNDPDLVVMTAHHRWGKALYVVGVTEAVLYRSTVSVLSVGI